MMHSEERVLQDDPFAKTERTVLRNKVVDAIQLAITSACLQPGDRVNESEIAASMGISKAPVREALRLLEKEGLVTTVPNKGSVVTRLSAQDIEEVFSLRGAVERMAVGRVAGQQSGSLVEELQRAVHDMKVAEQQADFTRQSEADARFHELIVRNSGNRRAGQLWTSMNGLIRMLVHAHIRMRTAQTNDVRDGGATLSDLHEAILAAIERGDRAEAQELVEGHCLRAGQRLAARARLMPVGPGSFSS